MTEPRGQDDGPTPRPYFFTGGTGVLWALLLRVVIPGLVITMALGWGLRAVRAAVDPARSVTTAPENQSPEDQAPEVPDSLYGEVTWTRLVDGASTWPLGDGARGTTGADYGGYVAADPVASVSRLVLCAVADPASVSGDEYRPASAVASLDVTTGEVTQVARPVPVRDPDRLDTTGWPTPDTTVIRVVDDPDSPAAGGVVQAGRADTGEDTVVPLTDREPGWRLEDDTLLDFSDRNRAVVAAPGGVVLAHRASSTTRGSAPGTYLVGLR